MKSYIERLSDNHLAIFLFHGVIKKQKHKIRNHNRKHIEKDYFFNILKKIKDIGYPLSMDELVCYHKEKKAFPPKSFIITFDDGFENNYSIAAPILEDLKLPATFYITTDFIERNQMSWIDKIEYCLEHSVKGTLLLPWEKNPINFQTITDKLDILTQIRSMVKKNKNINLDQLVNDFFSQCELPLIDRNETSLDLKMNWKQVYELSLNKNFIIGGHSHTHKILSFLDDNDLQYEIEKSIDMIKKNIHFDIEHYSYPEGLKFHFSEKVINTLKKNSIICCPTAEDGVNTINDDLFFLKRIPVT